MARALVAALEYSGHSVDLASRMQSRDGAGDDAFQRKLVSEAAAMTDKIIARGREQSWQVWITYHSYYKAPDLLGPHVAKALDIPYVQIEATRARKRLSGPWARFARIAEDACDKAALVFYLTQRDAEALAAYAPTAQRQVHLRPFLTYKKLPARNRGGSGLISVGMFRAGDKVASYELIAQTLSLLKTKEWQLSVVGSGPAEQTVRRLLAPFEDRIRYLGALDASGMAAAYDASDILLWPGVNEAFGMVYLEAQAAGLVAVAQARPGVCDVLAPGVARPAPAAGPAALARQIDRLLEDTALRQSAAQQARDYIAEHHLIASAARTLDVSLKELLS